MKETVINGLTWFFEGPRKWPKNDCEFLEGILKEQAVKLIDYPFNEDDERKLKVHKIKVGGKKEVSVSVPEDDEKIVNIEEPFFVASEKRESIKVQAKLGEIGEKLGMKIWLPRNDRASILELWKPKDNSLLEELPLVFDETTLKTIKNIDVLWIRRRSIIRAFEIEDKTSIYSGILRMADLLALQPMLDIKIHIVAPQERQEESLSK